MSSIGRISIDHIRNLNQVSVQPGPGVNLLFGENGAGKSAFLEAMHVLSTGRSFRTRQFRELVSTGEDEFRVVGEITHAGRQLSIGLEKTPEKTRIRINRQNESRVSALSRLFPTRILHPASFTLITGDPAQRRAFLDWGAFHQTPAFLGQWREYQRLLSQRNTALRSGAPTREIAVWDQPLAQRGVAVDKERRNYLQKLSAVMPGIASSLGLSLNLLLDYRPGWRAENTLLEALQSGAERDRQLGYTFAGPHRADLTIKVGDNKAAAFASRGQIKASTLALTLAQAELFADDHDDECVLLLDDLPSEFDAERLSRVVELLAGSDRQVFITTVDQAAIPLGGATDAQMFHVEHGCITPV